MYCHTSISQYDLNTNNKILHVIHYIVNHNHPILELNFPRFSSFPCLWYYKMERILQPRYTVFTAITQVSNHLKMH